MRLPRASPDRGNHAVTPAETNSGPVLVSLGTVSPAARSPSSAQKENENLTSMHQMQRNVLERLVWDRRDT